MEIESKIRHGLNTELSYDSPLQLLYPEVQKEKIVPTDRPKPQKREAAGTCFNNYYI